MMCSSCPGGLAAPQLRVSAEIFHCVSGCKCKSNKPNDTQSSTSSDICWCFSVFPCMVRSSRFSHDSINTWRKLSISLNSELHLLMQSVEKVIQK